MVGELVSKHYNYSKCSAIEEEDYDEDCPGTCVEDDDDSATIGLKTVSSDEDSALTDADTASINSADDADDDSSKAGSEYNYLPYVPIKSLKFYSKDTPPAFTYWKKIRLPIPPTKIIIQIQHVGLNPVDLRLINSYLKHNCGQLGVGREYSGVVLVVGEAMQSEWEEGEEVMGIYWHPRWLKGVCETSIVVDPRIDIVARVPAPISMRDASGALFCLGASYNLLYKLEQRGQLHSESNILIYGGTTSMGLFTIQLLKYYYRIPLDIVVVCSLQGVQQLHTEFADISDELVFIDYESVTDRSLTRTLIDMVRNRNLLECDAETGAVTSTSFNQGKFTVVIDFIGGYDIIEQADAIVAENGVYVTTVGDTMANYERDSFHSWGTPGSHARKWFGKILWDFKYERFSFEPTVRSTSENEWVDICVDLLYNQIVRVVVDRVYSWTKIHKALTYLSTGHAHGKVIVDVDTF